MQLRLSRELTQDYFWLFVQWKIVSLHCLLMFWNCCKLPTLSSKQNLYKNSLLTKVFLLKILDKKTSSWPNLFYFSSSTSHLCQQKFPQKIDVEWGTFVCYMCAFNTENIFLFFIVQLQVHLAAKLQSINDNIVHFTFR